MLGPALWRFLTYPSFFVSLLFLYLLSGCGVSGAPLSVSIPALPTEDLAGPCRFDLSMANSQLTQKGVLVLYERGDTDLLYNDLMLRDVAGRLNYSLLWAHQCNAKSTGDIQSDALKGPARVLFAALSESAERLHHPELATAGLIVYGFSAAGVLTATLANDQPDRLIGTIQYAAGSAETDLDNVSVNARAAGIPTLILANATDTDSGTQRSLRYFQRGRQSQASWAYAVQNQTGHCCNLSTRNIILPWIEDIAAMQAQSPASVAAAATLANFICTPDGVEDSQNLVDCKFTAASLGAAPPGHEESGWLPSETTGKAWLAWVTNPETN